MKPYQSIAYDALHKVCDFKGKRILEIGGDLKCEVARAFIEAGATEVVTINPGFTKETSELDGKIKIRPYSALELDKHFESGTFGAVFGVAILEHIPTTPVLLDQIYQVTAPGAVVYLHGGPIWTSARGHHVWVHVDGVHYRFNADKDKQGINPIPNFYHLLNDADSMREYLKSKDIPPAHVDRVVEHIYGSPNLSRITYRDFKNAVDESQFRQLFWTDNQGISPDEETAKQLAALDFAEGQDFGVRGVAFALERP